MVSGVSVDTRFGRLLALHLLTIAVWASPLLPLPLLSVPLLPVPFLSGRGASALAGPATAAAVDPAAVAPAASSRSTPPPAAAPGATAARRRAPAGTYADLGEALDYYRFLVDADVWRPLAPGPLLRFGSTHPQVRELQALLVLFDDLSIDHQGSDHFDRSLDRALRRYQARHGLVADGVLGPATRAALNTPPQQRVAQLRLNHQRQTQFRAQAERRYVQVNIPEYRLRVVEDGAAVLEMKAIVGQSERPTPLLRSQIESLLVNPSWNVPRSIAEADILPRWHQQPDYLQRHGYRIVSGWSRPRKLVEEQPELRSLPFYQGGDYLRLWQPPGEDNALGRFKFDFPNPYSVYLHDTPQRGLFRFDRRAFSSGCVRLERPELLARQLLDDPQRQTLEAALAGTRTRRLRLREPVPVYLTYWTAWIDGDGVLQQRADIYRQDPSPADALSTAALAPAAAELH